MSSKRYIPEQIVRMLRETEVALAHGQTTTWKRFFKRGAPCGAPFFVLAWCSGMG